MDADHDYGIAESEHDMRGNEHEDTKDAYEDDSKDNDALHRKITMASAR